MSEIALTPAPSSHHETMLLFLRAPYVAWFHIKPPAPQTEGATTVPTRVEPIVEAKPH